MVVLGQRGCIVTARTFPDLGNLKCKSPGSGSLCHPSKTIAWETLPGPSSVGYLDKRGTLGSLLKMFEVQGFRLLILTGPGSKPEVQCTSFFFMFPVPGFSICEMQNGGRVQ